MPINQSSPLLRHLACLAAFLPLSAWADADSDALPIIRDQAVPEELCRALPGPVGPRASMETISAIPVMQILQVFPANESRVDSETIVIADVGFQIPARGDYTWMVGVQMDTRWMGNSVSAMVETVDGRLGRVLEKASGTIRFCFPVKHIWPNESIAWPLVLQFHLLKSTSPTEISRGEAISEPLIYVSSDPEVAGRSYYAENGDLSVALDHLYTFYHRTQGLAKICYLQFPDLRSSISSTYGRWDKRHQAMKENVNWAYYQWVSYTHQQDIRRGSLYLDGVDRRIQQDLDSATEEAREKDCQELAGDLKSADWNPEERFKADLKLIRSQMGTWCKRFPGSFFCRHQP